MNPEKSESVEPEIVVGIQSGQITFSFKTDRSGSNLKDATNVIKELLSSHKSLLESFGRETRIRTPTAPIVAESVNLSSLNIMPSNVREKVVDSIRKISMFNLVLIFLNYLPLSYEGIMALSKELGKPISYDWLNTEFHRKRHRGLVRSEPIQGSKEKIYSLTEHGKRKAEVIIEEVMKK